MIKNCNHNSWNKSSERIDDIGNVYIKHTCNKCNTARIKIIAKIAGYANTNQNCLRYRWDDFPKPWNYFLNNIGPKTNNII